MILSLRWQDCIVCYYLCVVILFACFFVWLEFGLWYVFWLVKYAMDLMCLFLICHLLAWLRCGSFFSCVKWFTSCVFILACDCVGEKKCLNSELWHACAGPLVSLPLVGSRVVYFPQGHNEHVSNASCVLLVGFIELYLNFSHFMDIWWSYYAHERYIKSYRKLEAHLVYLYDHGEQDNCNILICLLKLVE